jgi:hypothetical protein
MNVSRHKKEMRMKVFGILFGKMHKCPTFLF